MQKKGFTLIEMLAVVIILSILFLVITPKLTALVKSNENSNKEAVEEKIIDAAREYVTNYNTKFLSDFFNEGDNKIITMSELENAGLIEESDYSDFCDFFEVKVELLSQDKIKYSINYNGAE